MGSVRNPGSAVFGVLRGVAVVQLPVMCSIKTQESRRMKLVCPEQPLHREVPISQSITILAISSTTSNHIHIIFIYIDILTVGVGVAIVVIIVVKFMINWSVAVNIHIHAI
jgi:hypothetical protein